MSIQNQSFTFDDLSDTAKDNVLATMLQRDEVIDRDADRQGALDFISIMSDLGFQINISDILYDNENLSSAGYSGHFQYQVVDTDDFKDHEFHQDIVLLNDQMLDIRKSLHSLYDIENATLINCFGVECQKKDDEDELMMKLGSLVFIYINENLYQKNPSQEIAMKEVALYKDYLYSTTQLLGNMMRSYRKKSIHHSKVSEFLKENRPDALFNSDGDPITS